MGILFGGWAREEEENKQWYIDKYGQEIGLQKYEDWLNYIPAPRKLVASKTTPIIYEGDIIIKEIDNKGKAIDEALVTEVKETGEILVRYLDTRFDGQTVEWKGAYRKLASTREYDTNDQ